MARYSFNKQTQYTKQEILKNYQLFQEQGLINTIGNNYIEIPCQSIEEFIVYMWQGRAQKIAFVKILRELKIDEKIIQNFL